MSNCITESLDIRALITACRFRRRLANSPNVPTGAAVSKHGTKVLQQLPICLHEAARHQHNPVRAGSWWTFLCRRWHSARSCNHWCNNCGGGCFVAPTQARRLRIAFHRRSTTRGKLL